MRKVRKILKHFFIILVYMIWLFGLNMVLPIEENDSNSQKQNTVIYTNKI